MTGIRDTLGTLKVSLFGGSITYQYWAEPSVLYIERCPLFGGSKTYQYWVEPSVLYIERCPLFGVPF